MQVNTLAELVKGWLRRSFPGWKQFVVLREDGELEVAVPAPPGSQAGHLRVFTSRGDLWVRFNPPRMCYPVDNRREMLSIIRQLLADDALFVATYRGKKWTGATLVRRGEKPAVASGEVAHIVSWSGQHDSVVRSPSKRRREKSVG